MVTKGDIVTGASQFMAIWSVTTDLTPEETVIMLGVLDDYALELESSGLHTGYNAPVDYGFSDPNDDSGISDWMAGPFKKMLAIQTMTVFGRQTTVDLAGIAKMAIQTLEHALVNVIPASNPATLPKGSGNEWAYRDSKFYSEESERIDTETGETLDEITLSTENQNYYP